MKTKILILAIILIPFVLLAEGFVLSQLWQWFIVPVFNIAPITIAQAIGLILTFSFLTFKFAKNHVNKDKQADFEYLAIGFIKGVCEPFIFLLIGYILTLCC